MSSGIGCKIPNARKRHIEKLVKKIVHLAAPEGYHASDGHTLPKLEPGDRSPGLGHYGLLSRNEGKFLNAFIKDLDVVNGLPKTHVQYHLLHLWDRHDALVAELLNHGRDDFLLIFLF